MIRDVTAWTTKSALIDPSATVAGLVSAGITTCSVMLNDYRLDEPLAPFRTHDYAKVVALADACHAAGIGVSLTTWIKPYRKFIEDAAETLHALTQSTRSTLLILDAEEVWVRAPGGMSHAGASALIGELFEGLPLGLTGIVYANKPALEGLAKICGTWIPQCYATTRDGSMDPNRAVNAGMSQWRTKFGEPERWVIGLAAYEQPPIPADYMRPCIGQVLAANLDAVAYWAHGSIAKRTSVGEFIASLTVATEGSIMPVLDIKQMPVKTRVQAVAALQGLLHAWGQDPGEIDGKPGPKTLSALTIFQLTSGLPMTGICDGGTWWALLRS